MLILFFLFHFIFSSYNQTNSEPWGFQLKPNHCSETSLSIATIQNADLSGCAGRCLGDRKCVGFHYSVATHRTICTLKNVTAEFSPKPCNDPTAAYYERYCLASSEGSSSHSLGHTWTEITYFPDYHKECSCTCTSQAMEGICTDCINVYPSSQPSFLTNPMVLGLIFAAIVVWVVLFIGVYYYCVNYNQGFLEEELQHIEDIFEKGEMNTDTSMDGPSNHRKSTDSPRHYSMSCSHRMSVDSVFLYPLLHHCCNLPRDANLLQTTHKILQTVPDRYLESMLCQTAGMPLPEVWDGAIKEFLHNEHIASCGAVKVFLDRTTIDCQSLAEAAKECEHPKFDKDRLDLVLEIISSPHEWKFPEEVSHWNSRDVKQYLVLEGVSPKVAQVMYRNDVKGEDICNKDFGWSVEKITKNYKLKTDDALRFLKFVDVVQSELGPLPVASRLEYQNSVFGEELDKWLKLVEDLREREEGTIFERLEGGGERVEASTEQYPERDDGGGDSGVEGAGDHTEGITEPAEESDLGGPTQEQVSDATQDTHKKTRHGKHSANSVSDNTLTLSVTVSCEIQLLTEARPESPKPSTPV